MRFLADANVLSEPLRLTPDPAVEAWLEDHHDRIELAAFTLGELLKGAALLPAGPKKNRLTQWIRSLETRYQDQIHPFDVPSARVWADYYANHQRAGRKPSVADSILAAVALQRGLTVATRNTDDRQYISLWITRHLPRERRTGTRSCGARIFSRRGARAQCRVP